MLADMDSCLRDDVDFEQVILYTSPDSSNPFCRIDEGGIIFETRGCAPCRGSGSGQKAWKDGFNQAMSGNKVIYGCPVILRGQDNSLTDYAGCANHWNQYISAMKDEGPDDPSTRAWYADFMCCAWGFKSGETLIRSRIIDTVEANHTIDTSNEASVKGARIPSFAATSITEALRWPERSARKSGKMPARRSEQNWMPQG